MGQDSADRLTAGTFFVLLQQALRPRLKPRDTVAGKADGLSNTDMLAALIRIVQPHFEVPSAGNTFRQQTSELRTCKNNGDSTFVPVGGERFAQDFNRLIANDLAVALSRTSDFINRFLDLDALELRLVQMLGTLIARDATIPASQDIVLLPGNTMTKAELLEAREVCLDGLILGVWGYVSLSTVPNMAGRATFDRWHRPASSPNAVRKFDYQLFNLEESWHPMVTRFDSNLYSTAAQVTPDDDGVIEAEIVDEEQNNQNQSGAQEDMSAVPNPGSQPNIVFNQYGSNSQQIGSVGTLNIGGRNQ